jgi:protein-tyrosine phosphatase
MIRDPYTVSQIARVIDIIRKTKDGAVLWHCTYGKDRTDLVTVLLLTILGIPRRIIRKDYLRSNLYLASEKEYALDLMVSRGFQQNLVENRVRMLYEVQEYYLDAMYRAIEQDYGDIGHFLKRGLYLTPRNCDDLCDRFLI